MFKSIACHLNILSILTASFACAETVTIRSGNGSVGTRDSFISFLLGPDASDFSSPLTVTDFANAQTGPAAYIPTPGPCQVCGPNFHWASQLPSDPKAQWVGTNATAGTVQGNTALYAQSFQITDVVSSATLVLHYAVDDALFGVYVNGISVCKNQIITTTNNFSQEQTVTCNDVGPALRLGTNYLYLDDVNDGGAVAGVIYSATFTTAQPLALPDIAVGDVWTTGFFVINTGSQAAQFTIQFFDNSGNSLPFPLSGGTMSTLTDSVPGQGANYYEASAPGMPLLVGWGLFNGNPSLAVQAVFRKTSGNGQFDEAAITSSSGSLEFVVPFDASTLTGTNVPLYTAIAIANLDPNTSANVSCVARDPQGFTIPNAVSVPTLNPRGHWSDYFFPALTGKRGTIDCTANTPISAVAFRFIGAVNSIFSSLPVISK